jgi:hypothetical protein
MRRSTWLALIATLLVLISASSLSRIGSLRTTLHALSLPALPKVADFGRLSLELDPRALDPNAAAATSLALGASALAMCIVRRRRSRGRRRTGRLLRLARNGCGTARIARETRLAQDAVRSLLHPAFPRERGNPAHARRRTRDRKDVPDRQLHPVTLRGARPRAADLPVAGTSFERTVS